MDRVFERFVETVFREVLTAEGFAVEPQTTVALTVDARVVETDQDLDGVSMKPDLIIKQLAQPVAVADAKYKRTDDIGDFKQPDVYQLLAYCAALGLPRGLLIYADSQPHTRQRAHFPSFDGDIYIEAISIDVTQPWQSILEQSHEAAHALVASFSATSSVAA